MAYPLVPPEAGVGFGRLRRPSPEAEIRREIGRVLGTLAGQRRVRRIRPPTEAEVAHAVAEFHARGGKVTVCPTAHAVPICNGAGREAQRWTV
ncbi:hypothetical protein GCM10010964_42880 [Caldovatus sediminis]|uniref:Uncharacterized protein n=1 Tax=Caldovatus sediminis TaxID=2041189 RepID=A0A8J2ZFS2_9PROT|nr:hypothetical protein [Caldovatus sediminis]GGG51035.1 hypothetical protein GCM10010964_42880 [Caldovatus sediminis]